MTKTFPVDALSLLASCTTFLSVAVLFTGSVVGICCSDGKSVVKVSLVTSLGRVVMSRSVVDAVVLVEIFVNGTVVMSFCFVNDVVASREVGSLLVVEFVTGVAVVFDCMVVCVSLLLAVEAMAEVVVTAVYGTVVVSFCFVDNVVA